VNFQSAHFLIFLALVSGVCWACRDRQTIRKNVLLAASYYFYACWDWRLASLLMLVTAVTFLAGIRIEASTQTGQRKRWLAFELLVCLGTLGGFKYTGFFAASALELMHAMGLQGSMPTLNLLLPLGISFFTFQALSYVIDVYRKQQSACTDWRDIALFVAFFPTVQAGPITRAHQLLPQFADNHVYTEANLQEGMILVVRGFVKKLLFADVLALHLVDPVFAAPANFSSLFLLLALYGYTFQIYMDVSAYTDVARGSAMLCGYRLPINFDRPYTAATLSNFWQRWHISVSSFFRDYLFISLGGSRHGNVYLNLMATFVAIGIWHGAGWNFVLYGFIHGAVICMERWSRLRRQARGDVSEGEVGLPPLAGIVLTFHLVVFSRLLFRASDLTSAGNYLQAMAKSEVSGIPLSLQAGLALGSAAILHWLCPRCSQFASLAFQRLNFLAQGIVLAMLGYLFIAVSVDTAPFLYFKF